MSTVDWIVMSCTLLVIVVYGMWKSRNTKNIRGFLLADRKLPWYHVGLSVMATQASAITFLSAPGQAYHDGMRFLQFYFGLPLAMIVLCTTFIPIFRKLNVYTAYEYLEKRFDLKTRLLTTILFLIQRGISTGITIYAPSIVLSTILGVNITFTTLFIGGIVIIYTVYGGTKAVSHTQLLQMCIIFGGLFLAAVKVIELLPDHIGFYDALHIAGKMDKLNLIDTKFDLDNRYNIWSGIIGGFFLQLSYFGTDQSQVGRYLAGSSVKESRLGLIMNAFVKIPMQFFILLIGILVFVFYQFNAPPVFFNKVEVKRISESKFGNEFKALETRYMELHSYKHAQLVDLHNAIESGNQTQIATVSDLVKQNNEEQMKIKNAATELMERNSTFADTNDTNYVFLTFVTQNLPVGLIGVMIAIIFLASMGSTASGLNSLASASTVDIYKRLIKRDDSEKKYLFFSRASTAGWGLFCILIAIYAGKMGNLLEAVNILGSLFYGTILGIFIVAFFFKYVKGIAVFYASIFSEVIIFIFWKFDLTAFLWLNVIGVVLVISSSLLIQWILLKQKSHR